MITEFGAKKIGEVMAFAIVGQETFEKGQTALESVLGAEGVGEYLKLSKTSLEQLTKIAQDGGVGEAAKAKSEKTGEKLRTMLDNYIGEAWDDSAELLEWLGFFTGAAIVHWNLVEGVGEKAAHDELTSLAAENMTEYHALLTKAGEQLKNIGLTR